MLFSNCSHRASLRPQLIILYEKCLRRESECLLLLSNAAVSAETLSHETHWQISPNKVKNSKAACWQLRQRVPCFDGPSVKASGWECGEPGTAPSWMMLNKEWAALQKWRRRGGGWPGGGGGRWRRVKEAAGADSIASSVLSIQSDSADWHN